MAMMSELTEADAAALQVQPLAERWWIPVVRGFAAIAFGLVTLTFAYGFATLMPPATGVRALVLLWGGYAVLDGLFNLAVAFRGARVGRRWEWVFVEAIISLLVAAVTFSWVGMGAVTLFGVIATWALLTGLAEVAAAMRLRRFLRGEWSLVLAGALSMVFGVLLLLVPWPGIVSVLWVTSLYAFAFGFLLIGLGLRLQRWAMTAPLPRKLGTSA